jgi:hypothetical protein
VLEELLGDDLVGVDIIPIQDTDLTDHARNRLHQLLPSIALVSHERRSHKETARRAGAKAS